MSDSGSLLKAFLLFGEPSSTGKKGSGGPKIEFMFNPKEISITKAADWKQKSSKKPTMPEYAGTKPQSITVEMFLDDSEGKDDVSDKIKQLMDAMEPHEKTKKDKPSPPFCSFGWGTKTYLSNAVIKTVAVKYTRFKPDGKPIRAVATVTIEELRPGTAGTNPTSGSPDSEVERIVRPGDTLASIAYEELGTPTLWRHVAEVNGVDDPFRLPPGTSLIIPSISALTASRNGSSANGTNGTNGSR
jgi:nucleoid-associated protein YgaU